MFTFHVPFLRKFFGDFLTQIERKIQERSVESRNQSNNNNNSKKNKKILSMIDE